MIVSPGYLKDQFISTFGPVAYVLEDCGIYFSVFLFLNSLLIIYVVLIVVGHLVMIEMTGESLGFSKTPLSAS